MAQKGGNMREVVINGRRIADDTEPYVIAELGSNHQGSIETCEDLITAAAHAGCSAVKLQKRDIDTLYTPEQLAAPYNSEHAFGATYGEHRRFLEFDMPQYQRLKDYSTTLGLDFFATAWDIPSADFLNALGVPAFKIASADLTSIPLIQYCAHLGPTIISTGGGTLDDVLTVARSVPWSDGKHVVYLQCTASYPVAPAEMNLRAIETYRNRLPDTVVGLSDHQDGIAMAPVAYALGARVFEKHFTLHRSWKGSDQPFSLEPDGMRRMVRDLQRVTVALGDGEKRPYPSEEAPLSKMRKPAGYWEAR